jgi:hypothetical protein
MADAGEAAVVREGRAIIEHAQERADGVPVRLGGGVAVILNAPADVPASLIRTPKDIDLLTDKRSGGAVSRLLVDLGYEPEVEFNALNGHRRLMFMGRDTNTQVDVFVGTFAMCHTIPLAKRLTLQPMTLPLAELLLMKLQIFELNEKDQRDIVNLLTCHPIEDHDAHAINGAYIASLCGQDWGLWRTCSLNLERTESALTANTYNLSEPQTPQARVADLVQRLAAADKSRKWRLRDRVGDRVRWYEEVEEVG